MAGLTIKDIARICDVSISTVSRAINNDPGINARTRERVLKVVKEFNYIPNNSARNLKMAESNTIVLLVKGINNPFFQSMFPYFQAGLEKEGYQYLLHTIDEDADEAYAAEEITKEKRLKGIIFLGGILDYPEVVLENIQVPAVLCSVAVASPVLDKAEPRISMVSIDDEAEAYKAVSYFCRKGHRRIAIIAGRKGDYTVGSRRLAGYRRALQDYGIPFDPELVGYQKEDLPEYSEANGYAAAMELLKSGRRFTAFLVISDRMAMGVYKAIYDTGKKIPEDYSVIGFDGIEAVRYMYPALTTMIQPARKMAQSSIDLLMDQINGDTRKKHVMYEAELHERDSVRTIEDKE